MLMLSTNVTPDPEDVRRTALKTALAAVAANDPALANTDLDLAVELLLDRDPDTTASYAPTDLREVLVQAQDLRATLVAFAAGWDAAVAGEWQRWPGSGAGSEEPFPCLKTLPGSGRAPTMSSSRRHCPFAPLSMP